MNVDPLRSLKAKLSASAEEKFLTPEVLTSSSMIGTQDELLERLHDLSDSGLNQVMILPNFDTRYDVIERVAKDIIPNVV